MGVTGLVIGSFLNVCISRMPIDQSIVYPPSYCPKCKKKLKFFDLIPLLSYLALRGRCRYCRKKISPRYPLVEALSAALLMALYAKTGLNAGLPAYYLFSAILLVIAFIDLEHMVIPDIMLIMGIVLAILYSIYNGSITASLWGVCFGFLFMFLLGVSARYYFKKEALGDGDVKLVVMLGAMLGFERTVYSILIASLSGALVGVYLVLSGRQEMDDYVPFAPFLAVGALAMIFLSRVL